MNEVKHERIVMLQIESTILFFKGCKVTGLKRLKVQKKAKLRCGAHRQASFVVTKALCIDFIIVLGLLSFSK